MLSCFILQVGIDLVLHVEAALTALLQCENQTVIYRGSLCSLTRRRDIVVKGKVSIKKSSRRGTK